MCVPASCSYCKHIGYSDIIWKGTKCQKGLYICTHPDSPMLDKILPEKRGLCHLCVPTHPMHVGVCVFNMSGRKFRPAKVADVLRKGNWVTRLISAHYIGHREQLPVYHHEVYHVGTFQTAQESYMRTGLFVSRHEEIIFRDGSVNGGKLSTHLVIELQGFGTYPENVRVQYILPYLRGRRVPYLDKYNIMRVDNLIAQRKNLSRIAEIDKFGRWEYV